MHQGWWPRNVARVAAIVRDFRAVRHNQGLFTALDVVNHRAGLYTVRRLKWLGKRTGVLGGRVLKPKCRSLLRNRGAKPGVLFIGYVEAGLGLGESLRGLISSIAQTALPFAVYPFNVNVETRLIGSFMKERYDCESRYDVNVVEMAADQLPFLFKELGTPRFDNSYNILRTYWELPAAPAEWAPLLDKFDEIWAPSTFVAAAFRKIFSGPIIIVPPHVGVDTEGDSGRQHFGMADGRFYFLFTFDYFSFPARKNPLGVLHAFQAAFPTGNENVGLVLKSTSAADQHLPIKEEIRQAACNDNRILIVDRTMPRSEILSLIRESDCYVSLHRSEGFGLGMAEAMAFGKVVIGTEYSGNTDFLSDRTGFPVRYKLRPVADGEYIWSQGQSWAEPDQPAAIEAMQRVFNDREERQIRAAAGKAFIEARYSLDNVGRVAERRLTQVLYGLRARLFIWLQVFHKIR